MNAQPDAVHIYALVDPRDMEAYRYVGQTHHTPKTRLRWHIRDARSGHKTHLYNWVRKLMTEGVKPEVVILEVCSGDEWQEREKYWIAHLRSTGHRLTNSTIGGDGTIGYHHKPETIEKLRILGRRSAGHPVSAEQREALRRANIGKVMSNETKNKVRFAKLGKSLSSEHKNRIALGLLFRTLSRGISWLRDSGVGVELTNTDNGLLVVIDDARACDSCGMFLASHTAECHGCNKRRHSSRAREIVQIDCETMEIVATHKSIRRAELAVGGKHGAIGSALKFPGYKTAYGYYWQYA